MTLDEMFNMAAAEKAAMPEEFFLPGTGDPHVHTRGIWLTDPRIHMVVQRCAAEHEFIMTIGNTDPPAINLETALLYKKNVARLLRPDDKLALLVAPLVNPRTDPLMVRAGWDVPPNETRAFDALKIFFAGVSNDYGNSIDDVSQIKALLMSLTKKHLYADRPIVVTWHAECVKDREGNPISIRDSEFYCVSQQITEALAYNPEVTHVIRHVSDKRTLTWATEMRARGYDVHVEICPQYWLLNEDSLFTSESGQRALMCNCLSWPRQKSEESRKAIADFALEGHEWAHFATDWAIHLEDMTQAKGVKINSEGIAVGGLNFLPAAAKSATIDLFMREGKQHLLAAFLGGNAAKLYGVELSGKQYRYVRTDWKVPMFTATSELNIKADKSRCFLGGKTMHWEKVA